MATFNKFNCFVEDLAEKVHNLGADTLKVMLTNTIPLSTNTVKANITEIGAGNGYTAGGTAASITSSAQTSGVYKLVLADVTFTASGGTMATWRWLVLYNDTSTSDSLIGWWDYGSALSLADTQTATADFSATLGVLTIT